ncbi:sulfite exporter TauE/SafE family protein [Actinomadura hibisca]|uniref:sulfite exporter TauE/SafE family protein n=1 Tax=Actinomadura hibisca TaxID=68565 RepID=UPI00082A9855|nr:sulfite exporter TauE/SafE family protein [Actinomadura hibisca]
MTVLIALALFGLLGGIGITALGPGGVLPTVGLFALTDLSPAEVAGTAIVTHIATGALGTAAYTRSGQLREPETRRTALVLAAGALVGTPLGVAINTAVSEQAFGLVLAALVAGAAALLWYREHHRPAATRPHPPAPLVAVLAVAVALVAGVVGIGGPMLTVPLLVALGVPVLESLAAAQAQSIVIAGVGSVGYIAHGSVDWTLAAIVGIPELAGVLLGWKIAHRLPTRTLKNALIIVLFALAPYLALHG